MQVCIDAREGEFCGVGFRGEPTCELDHVGDRSLTANLAHADTRAHSDHLPFDSGLDARLHVLEGLASNADWPDLGKIDEAIATDDEPVARILVAVQLHGELIARTYNVVCGHGHIRR